MPPLLHYLAIFLLFVGSVCCLNTILNVDELNSIHYAIDIVNKPVVKDQGVEGDVMTIVNKFGQEYRCSLPNIPKHIDSDSKREEDILDQLTDITVLLKPMETAPCLTKTVDWWTYEFCYGSVIKQYHLEDNKASGAIIILGKYDSEYNWRNSSDTKNRLQRFHSQYYVNGTKCDLTAEPRRTEVRFHCEDGVGDYLQRVDEPESCRYIVTVATSRVCHHPYLRLHPAATPHPITCAPLLTPAQHLKYLALHHKKQKEEEKENKKWLEKNAELMKEVEKSWKKPNILQPIPVSDEGREMNIKIFRLSPSKKGTKEQIQQTDIMQVETKIAMNEKDKKDEEKEDDDTKTQPDTTDTENAAATDTENTATDTDTDTDTAKEDATTDTKNAESDTNMATDNGDDGGKKAGEGGRNGVNGGSGGGGSGGGGSGGGGSGGGGSGGSSGGGSGGGGILSNMEAGELLRLLDVTQTHVVNTQQHGDPYMRAEDELEEEGGNDDEELVKTSEGQGSKSTHQNHFSKLHKQLRHLGMMFKNQDGGTTKEGGEGNDDNEATNENTNDDDFVELKKVLDKLKEVHMKDLKDLDKDIGGVGNDGDDDEEMEQTLTALVNALEETEKTLTSAKHKIETLKDLFDSQEAQIITEGGDTTEGTGTANNNINDKDGSSKDSKKDSEKGETRQLHIIKGSKGEEESSHQNKMEQTIKDRLQKLGLEKIGRKFEVKILTGSNLEDDDTNSPLLSQEETHTVQNMIVNLLTANAEELEEREHHMKLEENYAFNWQEEEINAEQEHQDEQQEQ